MAVLPHWLRIPRPQTFFFLMSLRTGVEMISLTMLFNKVTGIFGLLAIFTGFKLDATQLSMYLYSVAALILVVCLIPHIRKQSPMECLALAWFYTLDTIINTTCIAAFGVTWFMTISASSSYTQGGVPSGAPGSGTMNDTAGLTSPKYNVSEVDIVPSLAAGTTSGQDTVAIWAAAATKVATESTSLQHGIGLAESVPSLVIIVVLTMIRIYFILIMMAYARQMICQYLKMSSGSRQHLHMDGSLDVALESPFTSDLPEGHGWKGNLGRMMVWGGNDYFLGCTVDDDWEKGLSRRFEQQIPVLLSDPRGTFERERRARSGTGPPAPLREVTKVEV